MRVWRRGNTLCEYARVLAVAGLALGLASCGLDKDNQPAPIGPSETGISVELRALPDVVNADGVSQSVVELVLRDQNGGPAAGRAVLFEQFSGDGYITPSASSTYVGPVQTGLVMATSEDGTAVVVYIAGYNITTATVGVRPYSFNATSDFSRTIEIVQR